MADKCEDCGAEHPVAKFGATTRSGRTYVSAEVGELSFEYSTDDLPFLGGLAHHVAMMLKSKWCLIRQNAHLRDVYSRAGNENVRLIRRAEELRKEKAHICEQLSTARRDALLEAVKEAGRCIHLMYLQDGETCDFASQYTADGIVHALCCMAECKPGNVTVRRGKLNLIDPDECKENTDDDPRK